MTPYELETLFVLITLAAYPPYPTATEIVHKSRHHACIPKKAIYYTCDKLVERGYIRQYYRYPTPRGKVIRYYSITKMGSDAYLAWCQEQNTNNRKPK